MGKKLAILLVLLVLALTAGCGTKGQTLPTSPSPRPTLVPTRAPTPPPSPPPKRVVSVQNHPTGVPQKPTQAADELSVFYAAQPCVRAIPSAPIGRFTFNSAMSGGVLQALNAGVSPHALNSILHKSGIGSYPIAAAGVDLNGDKHEDAVVSIFDPNSRANPPQGVLLVFLCTEHGFEQAQTFIEPATPVAWSAPTIQFAQDLNHDGKDEIVISSAHCDAQGAGCVERYAILSWQKGGLVDLLADFPPQGVKGASAQIADPDGDFVYDFVLTLGNGEKMVWKFSGAKWRR